MPTILTAGDSVSAASSLAAGNDGLLNIVVGPAGGKLTAVALAADGTPTFIKQPVLPVQSMIRLHTGNGYGSTNTAIRRFLTVQTNQGTDITYADSVTLGATFTINVAGVYAMSYSDVFTAANYSTCSLNSVSLSTNAISLTTAERLGLSVTAANGFPVTHAVTAHLTAGSVIRPHAGGAEGPAQYVAFTIVRVS